MKKIFVISRVFNAFFVKTKFGKNMFAVGSNPEAANVSGVNVTGTIITVD